MNLIFKTNKITDDYEICEKSLGYGNNCRILLCIHKLTGTQCALKTLENNPKSRKEIELQWRACQNSDYIVKILDVYENEMSSKRLLLVVMELMENGQLFDKIIPTYILPFTEQQVAKIMFQICSAVRDLHKMNIAHRDLRPENLLLSSNDDIKLTDFGFAKEVSLGLITPAVSKNFSAQYAAPELVGTERYDKSCDIWSLGVIMYMLCCGYPPFYSTHGQQSSPGMEQRKIKGEYGFSENEWSHVSEEAKYLIHCMLETIPEKRSTIDEIMKSSWISHYFKVPETPLPSLNILNNDRHKWPDFQHTMKTTLTEMRIQDKKVFIKPLPTVNNPLLQKRLNLTNHSQLQQQQQQQQQQHQQEQQQQQTYINDYTTNDFMQMDQSDQQTPQLNIPQPPLFNQVFLSDNQNAILNNNNDQMNIDDMNFVQTPPPPPQIFSNSFGQSAQADTNNMFLNYNNNNTSLTAATSTTLQTPNNFLMQQTPSSLTSPEIEKLVRQLFNQ